MRVVVLGAGFGGLELTSRLAETCGDAVELVLIDKSDTFVFGFSKLDVLFGRVPAEHVVHAYNSPHFVRATVHGIDPVARRVETDAGSFDADVLVIALGADLHPEGVPGLLEGGHDFYTVSGAFAAREAVASFRGGRVVVAVTSTPFKCPPAPSETALLMHDYLTRNGLRGRAEISLVMPLPQPIPPSPVASAALLTAFAERGIEWLPNRLVRSLDPARNVAVCSDGEQLPYDLFLGAPAHRVPHVVADSGMTVDGWIPVDQRTLETKYPGVYAIGDVTSVGTPKAGVFAEGQAVVVADRIAAQVAGRDPDAEYSGSGICYVEFGGERIGRVEVTFRAGQPPVGDFGEPSEALTADKTEFGRARVARWFGRKWLPLDPA